jgi:hypothetical protein
VLLDLGGMRTRMLTPSPACETQPAGSSNAAGIWGLFVQLLHQNTTPLEHGSTTFKADRALEVAPKAPSAHCNPCLRRWLGEGGVVGGWGGTEAESFSEPRNTD